jgi:hypothetical protein
MLCHVWRIGAFDGSLDADDEAVDLGYTMYLIFEQIHVNKAQHGMWQSMEQFFLNFIEALFHHHGRIDTLTKDQ